MSGEALEAVLPEREFSADDCSAEGTRQHASATRERGHEVHTYPKQPDDPEGVDRPAAPRTRGGIFKAVFRLAVPYDSFRPGGRRDRGVVGHLSIFRRGQRRALESVKNRASCSADLPPSREASAFAEASADRRSLGGGWSADHRSLGGGDRVCSHGRPERPALRRLHHASGAPSCQSKRLPGLVNSLGRQ